MAVGVCEILLSMVRASHAFEAQRRRGEHSRSADAKKEVLQDGLEGESRTNGRLIEALGSLPDIGRHELVANVPYASVIDASLTHTRRSASISCRRSPPPASIAGQDRHRAQAWRRRREGTSNASPGVRTTLLLLSSLPQSTVASPHSISNVETLTTTHLHGLLPT